MSTELQAWAHRNGVSLTAFLELEEILDAAPETLGLSGAPGTEARVVSELRLEASQLGMRLWRNNSGAFYDDKGNFVRFGLGNDSKQFNTVCKSSDLIGISNKLITPADVGKPRGQLVAREAKKPGWKYTGTPREVGQLNFINIINRFGGDAAFATGPGTFGEK
jgi:hypothetical protein